VPCLQSQITEKSTPPYDKVADNRALAMREAAEFGGVPIGRNG
jgi:hypothetical protein